ncbi:septin-1-like [Panonychus citri]|uniref:septin-1-like n=1 Tax=Panonychus citri TaxID=50023 RepID=UPI0023077279|nr:septin-1-like [Panonychus citri]
MSSDSKTFGTNGVDNTVYLGFANLPNQVHRKSVKKGFEFTLMVVGESGLGKSTLINALFYSQLYKERKVPAVQDLMESTVNIKPSSVEIEEKGVKLKLTVVDTPGFGDAIDNTTCIQPIISYIDEQYGKFLEYESGLNRKHIADSRIHCCFYFISPVGYGLKPLDIQAMKSLHTKVNLIPIIGKADALTRQEVTDLKKRIMKEIEANGISIYTVPDCDSDEDEDYKEQIRLIKNAVPFAVSSSCELVDLKGRKVQGRQYPWGILETENPEHSDFVKLKSLLVTHMQDLREVTHEVHYENYREMRLTQRSSSIVSQQSLVESLSSSDDPDRILREKEEELMRMKQQLLQLQSAMKHPTNGNNGTNGTNGNNCSDN